MARRQRPRWVVAAAVALAGLVACSDVRAGDAPLRAVDVTAGEGGAPVPLDSALALFRRDLSPATALEHSAPSIPLLIERFARSIEQSDTAAIREMVMSRREFAYLYYPSSPFTRPPTKQEPGLAWFLHLQPSRKGVTRLFNRFGGRPFRVLSNECKSSPRAEGENVIWDDCLQSVTDGRDTVTMRLFHGIYERAGRFKIFSYSNDL